MAGRRLRQETETGDGDRRRRQETRDARMKVFLAVVNEISVWLFSPELAMYWLILIAALFLAMMITVYRMNDEVVWVVFAGFLLCVGVVLITAYIDVTLYLPEQALPVFFFIAFCSFVLVGIAIFQTLLPFIIVLLVFSVCVDIVGALINYIVCLWNTYSWFSIATIIAFLLFQLIQNRDEILQFYNLLLLLFQWYFANRM